MRGGVFWSRSSLDRGILVYARSFEARPELTISETYQDTDVVYFKDGNNATISVRKGEDYVGLAHQRKSGRIEQGRHDHAVDDRISADSLIIPRRAPR